MPTTQRLSVARINRMKAQGYRTQTDAQLSELAFGNRFAYRLCAGMLILAVISQSTFLLSMMLIIAFSGVMLENHPFDYIYNHFLAESMGKPKLPKRSVQLKFACAIATVWIATTIYLFTAQLTTAAFVMGGLIISLATLVGTTDICIPSIIYNVLFDKKGKAFKVTQLQDKKS